MSYLKFFAFTPAVLDSGEECHGIVWYSPDWSIKDRAPSSLSYMMVL